MRDAVVFNGIQSLDFAEIRRNVVRIPDVTARLSEAQQIWDNLENSSFSFYNFLISEDSVFQGSIKLKGLATAIVQVGLYDRYIRHFQKPMFLLGPINGDSPLKVAAGEMSLTEMIESSKAREMTRPESPLRVAEAPVLAGISLSEYSCFSWNDEESKYFPVFEQSKNFKNVVEHAMDKEGIAKFVNIGPGNNLLNRSDERLGMADIQILESIDLDPMLNWFWREVNRAEVAEALA